MGLDQYLFRYRENNLGKKSRKEIMYWRKANEIHNFFDIRYDIENCEEQTIELDDLIELKNICKEVLQNRHKANELLPTMGGFFFGTTDYDEWYFDSLATTKDSLTKIIDEHKDGDYYEYYAWW